MNDWQETSIIKMIYADPCLPDGPLNKRRNTICPVP